jgi:hypothetical protein
MVIMGSRDVWVIVPDSVRERQTPWMLGWGGVETNAYNAEYRAGHNLYILFSVAHKVVESWSKCIKQ